MSKKKKENTIKIGHIVRTESQITDLIENLNRDIYNLKHEVFTLRSLLGMEEKQWYSPVLQGEKEPRKFIYWPIWT